MKKFITVLVLCMALSLLVVGASAAYTDVESGSWYEDAILFCQEEGLMDGIGGGLFDPNGNTTRGMVVTVLWRMEGKPTATGASFTDVKADAYYADAVAWASAEKIAEGYGDGRFGPDDLLTREQLVTILFRYAQSIAYDVSVGEETNILSYDDAFSISEWAIPAMQWACGDGMIEGTGTALLPKNNANRAQLAVVLTRFAEKQEAPIFPDASEVSYHFHVYSYNGDQTHSRCCDGYTESCVLNTAGKCDVCSHQFVATIGATGYDTLASALKNAPAGATIQLYAGEYGNVEFPNYVKDDLTIMGGEGVSIQKVRFNKSTNYSAPAGLTFQNITFDGEGIVGIGTNHEITGLSVVDCTFTNGAVLTVGASCIVDGLTVKGCTFGATTGSVNTAILLQGSVKNVKIEGNTIEDAAWNAIQMPKIVGAVEIRGNIITNTGSRGIRLVTKTGAVLTVTDNTMKNANLNPDEAIGNEGEVLKVSGTVKTGTFADNTIDGLAVFMTTDKDGNPVGVKGIAQVGNTYYTTLADAVAAGGTVKLLRNYEIVESIEVANTVTVDLNGKKLTGPDDGAANWYAFVVDGGNLTLKDSVGTGELYAKCYGIEIVSGKFTLESGKIDSTNNKTLGAAVVNYGGTAEIKGGEIATAAYAVDTQGYFGVATTIVSGGDIAIEGATSPYAAMILVGDIYDTYASSATVTGGNFAGGYVFVLGSNAEKCSLTVQGGTYDSDPSYYLSSGYVATENAGIWTVTAE